MATIPPPLKTSISDTYPNPSNAVARAGFGSLWDYVTNLLGLVGSPSSALANLTGYTTTTTAAGTTTLTNASTYIQYFTGTNTQIIQMPVTSTLTLGWSFNITNNSTGNLTLNSSGGNFICLVLPNTSVNITCILITGTTAASWDFGVTNFNTVIPESIGGTGTTTGYYGFKNRIINGAMVIDQRNAGAVVTPTNGQYLVDRWFFGATQASKFTSGQGFGGSPVGFSNYYAFTSSSAYSVLTGDFFTYNQVIEGFNVADLSWGTVNAKAVTLSFQVLSSLTGTFGGSVKNSDSSRSYPFSYSIPVANTWTTVSITIAGDTTGTWLTNNGKGLSLVFSLGAGATFSGTAGSWAGANYISATGATSVVGTNGSTFYITGVQLEKGSTATSFDYRPYGTELQLCQRYLPAFDSTGSSQYYVGQCAGGSICYASLLFPVTTRAIPTGITLSAAASAYGVTNAAAAQLACTAITFNSAGYNAGLVGISVASGLVAGNATLFNVYGNKIFFTGCEL